MKPESLLERLNLDKWYGIVLYLGVLSVVGAAATPQTLFNRKHLAGLGIGMILIGISFFKAQKVENHFINQGILYRDIIKHDFFSGFLLAIGILLTANFGFLAVKDIL